MVAIGSSYLYPQTGFHACYSIYDIGAAMHSSEVSSAWLGRRDSNPRMTAPEAVALPLGDSPTF
jgi:hypothetical protein